MMRTSVIGAVIFTLIFQSSYATTPVSLKIAYSVKEYPEIRISTRVIQKEPKIFLRKGEQRFIWEDPFSMDIGMGKTNCLLFVVPRFKKDIINMEFVSSVRDSEMFFPVIITLDDDYNVNEIIIKPIEIQSTGFGRKDYNVAISIDQSTRYILVTTIPELLSSSFIHSFEVLETIPFTIGSSVYYINRGTATEFETIRFIEKPGILVRVASGGNRRIFMREDGIYLGIGTNFGGEKVADNPSGDNYRAGGGGIISMGISHSVFTTNFVGRYGGGIRYQGSKDGDARNLGYIAEAVLTYQTRYFNFGFGGQIDMGNSTRHLDGNVTRFKRAIGPKFTLEWRAGGFAHLGFEYLTNDFYTTENQKYRGNRIGVTARFFF
jgi:hypothetical protein